MDFKKNLNKEKEKEEKLLSLFKSLEKLIDELEHYVVHQMDEEDIEKKKEKVEKYLNFIRGTLEKEEKELKKILPKIVKRGSLKKSEFKEIQKTADEREEKINELIREINQLIKEPSNKLIDKINELVRAIENMMRDDISELEKIAKS